MHDTLAATPPASPTLHTAFAPDAVIQLTPPCSPAVGLLRPPPAPPALWRRQPPPRTPSTTATTPAPTLSELLEPRTPLKQGRSRTARWADDSPGLLEGADLAQMTPPKKCLTYLLTTDSVAPTSSVKPAKTEENRVINVPCRNFPSCRFGEKCRYARGELAPCKGTRSPSFDTLVWHAKRAVATSDRHRAKWHLLCDSEGNGERRPTRHRASFLIRFLDECRIEAPVGIPPPETRLVDAVERVQRSSHSCWLRREAFCYKACGGTRDPAEMEHATLRRVLDSIAD